MESSNQKKSRKKGAIGIVLGAGAVVALIAGFALASGGSAPANPNVNPNPQQPPATPPPLVPLPIPQPAEPKEPKPVKPQPDPPSPDNLTFDLEGNWGGIPKPMREWLAKAELASGIPGLARAAGARWWESFRAKKPLIATVEEATLIAATEPANAPGELARYFVNEDDGPQAEKAILEDMAKQGWPKPKDIAGWSKGSFGLGDILGSTFVYTGIHTEGKKAGSGLPFVVAPSAKEVYQSYEGQIAALAYIVYRVLYREDIKVAVPKIQAPPATQNPKQTWINIFAAYAYPDSYKSKGQLAANAAANYEKRAAEIGIDLNKVAFPWPPGMTYKTWDFGDFWARLQAYAPQKVTHLPSVYQANAELPNQGFVLGPNKLALQGNVQASIASVIPDGVSAPLVIFLHDRDADESQLAGLVLPEQVNARLVYLRAPIKSNPGYRWFDTGMQGSDAVLAQQLEAATDVVSLAGQQLAKLYPGTSQVYVVGLGQGGAIAYRLAARGEVARVLSIGGKLPPSLRLQDGQTTKTGMVLGVHGENDQVVSAADDAATIESFIFKTDARLTVVPGATHALSSVEQAVGAKLVEMLQ